MELLDKETFIKWMEDLFARLDELSKKEAVPTQIGRAHV